MIQYGGFCLSGTTRAAGDHLWLEGRLQGDEYRRLAGTAARAARARHRGRGHFYGDSPGASFRSLAALLDGQAHAFSHPVYGSINACMTELVSDEQAENGILRYRFRLLEIL